MFEGGKILSSREAIFKLLKTSIKNQLKANGGGEGEILSSREAPQEARHLSRCTLLIIPVLIMLMVIVTEIWMVMVMVTLTVMVMVMVMFVVIMKIILIVVVMMMIILC